ncbi:MAG: dihydrodipicolinate synthase family protein [Caldilinea sp.]|nr:dihydrodipicolinate synthase family protein [Caldilinea sp.]MDW8439348.1 dihydrodipicolinate synthase family protein [Caldilineaceae bacterium]
MNFRIQGVVVPILTPMMPDGALNVDALPTLVNFLMERGVAGLFVGGSTGEGPLLNTAERKALCEATVAVVAGRRPVIVQTGAVTTAESIELTLHAHSAGADAAALIAPYYYAHSTEALFRHFAAVAEACEDFPLYLYNFPAVSNNWLRTDLVRRLVERFPNIVGIKDSSGALENLIACTRMRNGQFNTFVGSDGLILAAVASGVDGAVSGNANVVPEIVVRLHRAALAGDVGEARKWQAKLDAARTLMGDGGNLALYKALLARRGVELGSVRPPLLPVEEEAVERCWHALQALLPKAEPI